MTTNHTLTLGDLRKFVSSISTENDKDGFDLVFREVLGVDERDTPISEVKLINKQQVYSDRETTIEGNLVKYDDIEKKVIFS